MPSFVRAPKRRCELSSDAWDRPGSGPPSCGSRPAIAHHIFLLGKQYESGAAPDGPHLVAELPDPSTPCRTDARCDSGAPRRKGQQVASTSELTRRQQHTSRGQHGPAPPE